MHESILIFLGLLWTFLSFHIGAVFFYSVVSLFQSQVLKLKLQSPVALYYLPLVYLFYFLSEPFVEAALSNSDFWLIRHADSFMYETRMSFSLLAGLLTYHFSLRAAYKRKKRRRPQLFLDETRFFPPTRGQKFIRFCLIVVAVASAKSFYGLLIPNAHTQGFIDGVSGRTLQESISNPGTPHPLWIFFSGIVCVGSVALLVNLERSKQKVRTGLDKRDRAKAE